MRQYKYTYLNTSFQSNFDIFLLNKYQFYYKNKEIDVEILLKECSSKDLRKKNFFDINLRRARLEYEGLGHFKINNGGKRIICYFDNNKRNYINFLSKLLNHAIPYALYQQKKFCLHTSALEMNNTGTLFTGQPGSGKSSIAAYLSRYFNLICEDSSVISQNKGIPYILPALPVVKVKKDVVNLCKLKDSIGNLNDSRKREYYNVSNFAEKPIKVSKCIYLEWADDYQIRKITNQKQKVSIIFSSAYTSTNLLTCKDSSKTLMQNAAELINNIDFYSLCRPKDYNFSKIDDLLKGI